MSACVETVPSQDSSKSASQGKYAPPACVSAVSLPDLHRAPEAPRPTARRSWFGVRWLGTRRARTAEGFLATLPVGALPGVGPAYSRTLVERGVATVGQLRRIPKPVLVAAFGKAIGKHIWECARS
jgi:hypothetical protein